MNRRTTSGYYSGKSKRYRPPAQPTQQELREKFEKKIEKTIEDFRQDSKAFVIVSSNYDRDNIIKKMFNEFEDEITMQETNDWKSGSYYIHFYKTVAGDRTIHVDKPIAIYWGRNSEREPIFFTGVIYKIDSGKGDITVKLNSGFEEVVSVREINFSNNAVLLTKDLTSDRPYLMSEIAEVRIKR